jgi:hypothetical protein
MTGWLPVQIGFDTNPAVVREAMVRWAEFGDRALAEPFFDHTVEQLRQATPAAREIETDLETMLRVATRTPAIRPAGFIFHLSHCGSTLIANALKTSERAVVVSESRAVHALLRTRTGSVSPYLAQRWESTRVELLQSLFSLFAHYRTGEAEPLAIKFVSLDILAMRWVRACWPDVPCVVVIRDPVEVMVTSLKGGGWMSAKNHPEYAVELFGWTGLPRPVEAMIREEFCARVLGSFCSAALAAITEASPEKCMVVDYLDLNPNRIREIAAFFSINLPGNGKSVESVFETYAKDPRKTVPFRDDRELKQRLAGVLLRSAANQFAMDSYSELRKRR